MEYETYEIRWTGPAREDLTEIIEYIAEDNANTALRILEKIETAVSKLDLFPKSGRVVPELEKYDYSLYREIIISPWRVKYRIEDKTVYIMTVIDGRRNVEDLLLRKLYLR
jgi:addiction module RelE/StbE family toxin